MLTAASTEVDVPAAAGNWELPICILSIETRPELQEFQQRKQRIDGGLVLQYQLASSRTLRTVLTTRSLGGSVGSVCSTLGRQEHLA